MTVFVKRMVEIPVGETKEYLFDFSPLLVTGETIASKTVTAASGVTKNSDTIVNSSTAVKVDLTGVTAGENPVICCTVVTSDSRTYKRSMVIPVIEVC